MLATFRASSRFSRNIASAGLRESVFIEIVQCVVGTSEILGTILICLGYIFVIDQANTPFSVKDYLCSSFSFLDTLNRTKGAYGIDLGESYVVLFELKLQNGDDFRIRIHGCLHCCHGHFSANRYGCNEIGENHEVFER